MGMSSPPPDPLSAKRIPRRNVAAHLRSRPPRWLACALVIVGCMLVIVGAIVPCASAAGQCTCSAVGGILLVAAAAQAFGHRTIGTAVKALRGG